MYLLYAQMACTKYMYENSVHPSPFVPAKMYIFLAHGLYMDIPNRFLLHTLTISSHKSLVLVTINRWPWLKSADSEVCEFRLVLCPAHYPCPCIYLVRTTSFCSVTPDFDAIPMIIKPLHHYNLTS